MELTPPGFDTEGLRIAVVLLDRDDHIIHLDEAAERLTGFRRRELIGRDSRVLTLTGKPLFDGESDTATQDVVTLRRHDGGTRVVSAHCHVIPMPGGLRARLVQLVDFAELLRGPSHLGLLEVFFHQAPFGLLILDEQLRYVMVNETLAEFNNRPLGDHIGRHIREVLASPDIDAYEKLLRGVLHTGEPVVDVTIPRTSTADPDSRKVASASWFRVANRFGLPLALCGLVHDVSRQQGGLLVDSRARERAQLLGAAGAVLGAILDMDKLAANVADLLTSGFCDLVVIDVLGAVVNGGSITDDRRPGEIPVRLAGASRIADPLARRLIGDPGPRPWEACPGLSSVLSEPRARLYRRFEDTGKPIPGWMRDIADELDASSYLVAPLRARGATLGVLSCLRLGAHTAFDAEDLSLAEEIADRTAMAVDNARLYRRERQTAQVLQLGLLPAQLPTVPEAALECRYLPGHLGRQAGGDWYDAVALPGHRVALFIGDVVGHDLAAAAAMGRYRSVVSTLASVGLAAGTLLTRLNEIAGTFGEDALATCLCVYYDPAENRCGVASAGHPPPLLTLPGAPTRPLTVRTGPMLGATADADYPTTVVETPPGTRLLLYSDGLVESRRRPIDTGIAELARRLGLERPLPEQADELMTAAPSDNWDDRTLLLAELRSLDGDETGR